MAPIIFDTLKAKKTLTSAGVGEEQAEAFVGVFAAVLENVAAKGDIADLKVDVSRLENRMLIGFFVATAIIIAVLKFF